MDAVGGARTTVLPRFRALRDRAPLGPSQPLRLADVALLLLGAAVIGIAAVSFGHPLSGTFGWDFQTYRDAAARWLAGGGFYDARELAGPWTFVTSHEIVYPPSSLALFLPFVVLPAILWWSVPAALIGWSVWQHRPHALAWLLMAVAVSSRMSLQQWWVGNPVIWCAAAVALATVRPYLGPLVLVKPTWAPLALIGARDRRWWLLLAGWGVVVVATLPLWPQYLTVMSNFRGIPVYWLPGNAPVIAVPVLAWLGSTRRRAVAPRPAPWQRGRANTEAAGPSGAQPPTSAPPAADGAGATSGRSSRRVGSTSRSRMAPPT